MGERALRYIGVHMHEQKTLEKGTIFAEEWVILINSPKKLSPHQKKYFTSKAEDTKIILYVWSYVLEY